MTITNTVLEWVYTPPNLFEVGVHRSEPDYELDLNEGHATVTLAVPQDPVPDSLIQVIGGKIDMLLKARTARVHRSYTLDGPGVRQILNDGRRDVTLRVQSGELVLTGGLVDIVVRDAAGNVKHDTKTERIAVDEAFNRLLEQAAAKDPLVKPLLASYQASVDDPDNELTHLYEIRDAMRNRFVTIGQARQKLGISQQAWGDFDNLANDEPILEGRHRGKYIPNLRHATQQELEQARSFALSLIVAYAGAV